MTLLCSRLSAGPQAVIRHGAICGNAAINHFRGTSCFTYFAGRNFDIKLNRF